MDDDILLATLMEQKRRADKRAEKPNEAMEEVYAENRRLQMELAQPDRYGFRPMSLGDIGPRVLFQGIVNALRERGMTGPVAEVMRVERQIWDLIMVHEAHRSLEIQRYRDKELEEGMRMIGSQMVTPITDDQYLQMKGAVRVTAPTCDHDAVPSGLECPACGKSVTRWVNMGDGK